MHEPGLKSQCGTEEEQSYGGTTQSFSVILWGWSGLKCRVGRAWAGLITRIVFSVGCKYFTRQTIFQALDRGRVAEGVQAAILNFQGHPTQTSRSY